MICGHFRIRDRCLWALIRKEVFQEIQTWLLFYAVLCSAVTEGRQEASVLHTWPKAAPELHTVELLAAAGGLHEPLSIHSLQHCTIKDLVNSESLWVSFTQRFFFEANMISHTENSELCCVREYVWSCPYSDSACTIYPSVASSHLFFPLTLLWLLDKPGATTKCLTFSGFY